MATNLLRGSIPRLLFFAVLLLFVVGCGAKTPETLNPHAKPAWIDNPRIEGNIVGLGSAKSHFNGINAQRKLAIERATDEIAKQLGVNVTSQLLTTQSTQTASTMDAISLQTVEKTSVKATIKHE